jgi:hypothetical protein
MGHFTGKTMRNQNWCLGKQEKVILSEMVLLIISGVYGIIYRQR